MQCRSCKFENMPGSQSCARCGAQLEVAATVGVHPPRASKVEASMWPWRRIVNRCSEMIGGLTEPIAPRSGRTSHTGVDSLSVLVLLVPGLAHWRRGDRLRSHLYFWGSLAALVPGIVMGATNSGGALLGLAFAVHVASIVDATVTDFASMGDRLRYTLVVGLLMSLLVYLPIGIASTRVATPIRVLVTTGSFQAGDVVWYNRYASPTVGAFVLYNTPVGRQLNYDLSDAALFFAGPQQLSRVLAIGGQTVSWRKGKLYVDGELSGWQPTTSLNHDFTIEIPATHVCISPDDLFPETFAALEPYADEQPGLARLWERASVVPASRVVGVVYFRTWPLGRTSVIR